MKTIIDFLIYYVLIYVLYLLFVVFTKKEDKYKNSSQVQYFVKRYHLDFNKISYKKFIQILALTNSFIMAFTLTIVSFIPHIMLKLLVAFVLLMILILLCYKLIGVYIERRNKNV